MDADDLHPPEKPFYAHISIDMLNRILHSTFLNPFFVFLIPLAYRAQSFTFDQGPLYWSTVYLGCTALYRLLSHLNTRLSTPPPRPTTTYSHPSASPPPSADDTEEVIVITGGSSGLGLLLAEIYGMRGVTVAILDVTPPQDLSAPNITFYRCDVGSAAAVSAAATQIAADLGAPTVLINNAAIAYGKPVLSLSASEAEHSIRTNLLGHFHTARAFLPHLLASPTGGMVVTVSSALAQLPAARCADYAAAKAGVRALHHSLTAELRGGDERMRRVRTLLVSPGQMSTPLFAGVATPNSFLAPVLEPVDVAREIVAHVDRGAGGELAMPLYARWVDLFWCAPASVRRALRWASGMDRAMEGFRGAGRVMGEEEEEEEEEDEKETR